MHLREAEEGYWILAVGGGGREFVKFLIIKYLIIYHHLLNGDVLGIDNMLNHLSAPPHL